jgi:hypothetical protein
VIRPMRHGSQTLLTAKISVLEWVFSTALIPLFFPNQIDTASK